MAMFLANKEKDTTEKFIQGFNINDTGEVCSNVCYVGEKAEEFSTKKNIIILGLGTLIYIVALVLELPFFWELSLFLLGYIVIARDIVWKAAKNVFHGQLFDENFLMTIATVGAFAIKEFPEAVAVMLFYKIGELFEGVASAHSHKSIKSLLEMRPDYANLKVGNRVERVDPRRVRVGDIIVVKPGEKVPLDGIILEGSSMVDTSALTGESIPRKLNREKQILSGMINKTGLLSVRVTKKFSESTVSKILDLMENAATKKAPTEKFITKFAKYYTPIVVFSAIALAIVPVILYNIPVLTPMFAHEETFSEWMYKALIFLVISCPCALVISIPLGFFGGIGASSKRGVLVKGSNYLEGLNNLHVVVWDKTGTLTKGIFEVAKIVLENHNLTEGKMLEFVAKAESQSHHPIARSILKAFDKEVDESELESYEEIPGYGIKAKVAGHSIFVGNDKMLHKEGIKHNVCSDEGTVVYAVIDHEYAGYVVISDEVKEDSSTTIQKLKDIGVKRQIMLTGDNDEVARAVAQKLGLEEYFAELLPQQKVEKIEELIKQKENKNDMVAFVGDGINDAPVLIRSDIGIAMGALGSDAAIEAADIVLMTDEPSRIFEAVKVAKRTRKILWQNIGFAVGVKGIFLAMGALGAATMWEAVFADVGVALLAILNSTRVLRYSRK